MNKNTLVWCKAKEQVLATLKVAKEMGCRFSDKFADHAWNCCGNKTVLNLHSDSRIVTYCYKEWYEERAEYGKIITAEKFLGQKPIIITKNGRLTIAEDKNTGEKGIAACSPDDTYDFHTGALIAVARLVAKDSGISGDAEIVLRKLLGDDANSDAPTEEEPTTKFKAGDLVTLKDGIEVGKKYGDVTFLNGMYDQSHSKPIKVVEADSDNYYYCASIDNNTCYWYSEEMLEAWDEDKIREGDIVRVVNTGLNYSAYPQWVGEHISDPDMAARYCFSRPSTCTKYKVIKIAEHESNGRDLAYIEEIDGFSYNSCYLIGVKGLTKVTEK